MFTGRYVFRGNAVGVAAHFRWSQEKKNQVIVPVQGSLSLPAIGGYASTKSSAQEFGSLLSFRSIQSRAAADFNAPEEYVKLIHEKAAGEERLATTTEVTTIVKGLDVVAGAFKAATIQATLVASSPANWDGQPAIRTANLAFDGIRVAGGKLKVTINTEPFDGCPTLEELQRLAQDSERFGRVQHQFPRRPKDRKQGLPHYNGTTYCTVVSELAWDGKPGKGATIIQPNVVAVEEFGRIHFGELLITGNSRRLTMVRLRLGCPTGGDCMAAEVESNGGFVPPPG